MRPEVGGSGAAMTDKNRFFPAADRIPAMAGEFDFIEWIKTQIPPDPRVAVGIGDDLAALRWEAGDLLLVGVDQVLDGVHFDSSVHAPRDIGRKVMNRNLSDCAAMACRPAAAVATVALPRDRDIAFARELFTGMNAAARQFGCTLIGGDTASWSGKLALTVTILARADGIEPVTRAGAAPGDLISVTGPLGGSILGRHMSFAPKVELARKIASLQPIHAMIDLSDGLSRDLGHICRASNVGAVIHAGKIPIHDDAQELFRRDRISPLEHALHDGEDYELLIVHPQPIDLEGISTIGHIVPGAGLQIEVNGEARPLEARGWEHRL
jgi:thiamine-monophosphate kinase